MSKMERDKKVEASLKGNAVLKIAEFIDEHEADIYLSVFVFAYYAGLNCTELVCDSIINDIRLIWLINNAEPSFNKIQDYRENNENKIRETLIAFRSFALSNHLLRYEDILFKGYKPTKSTKADKLSKDGDDIERFLRDYAYNDRYEHPVKRPDFSVEGFQNWLKEIEENDRLEDEEAERDRSIIGALK